jgi:hypothetical protein
MARGSAPSAIPSFVNEAMNAATAPGASNVIALASGQPLPGPDTNLAGWAAVAASFDSSEDSA